MAGSFKDAQIKQREGDQPASDTQPRASSKSDVDRMGLARERESEKLAWKSIRDDPVWIAEQEQKLEELLSKSEKTSNPQSKSEKTSNPQMSLSEKMSRFETTLLEDDYNKRFAKEDLIPVKPNVEITNFQRKPVRDQSSGGRGDQSKLQGSTSETEWQAALEKLKNIEPRDSARSRGDSRSSVADQLHTLSTMKRSTNTFRRPARPKIELDKSAEQRQKTEQQERIDPKLASLNDKQIAIVTDIKKHEEHIARSENALKRTETLIDRRNGEHAESTKRLDDVIKALEDKRDRLYKKTTEDETSTSEGLTQLSELSKDLRKKTQEKFDRDSDHFKGVSDLLNHKNTLSDQLKHAKSEKSLREAELQRINSEIYQYTGHPQQAPRNIENQKPLETSEASQRSLEGPTTQEALTANIRGPKDLEDLEDPAQAPPKQKPSIWDRIIEDRESDKRSQENDSEPLPAWAKQF